MSFRNWTCEQVANHNGKISGKLPVQSAEPEPSRGEALEETLAQKIIEECDRRGWIWNRSRTDKPTTRREGELDFDIKADGGRNFNIECKARGAKMTPKQRNTLAWLRKLGHQADCVWTFEEFLEIIK